MTSTIIVDMAAAVLEKMCIQLGMSEDTARKIMEEEKERRSGK